MVRVHVSHPRIFGLLFLFVGEVEQKVKTTEIQIALNSGSHLLIVEFDELAGSLQKFIHEPVFLFAETDFRRLSFSRLLLRHGFMNQHIQ